MNRLKYVLPLFLLLWFEGSAQLEKVTINGYVKDMYMYYNTGKPIEGLDVSHLSSNLIHNRLNFRWYATDELTLGIEARNRIFCGQLVRKFPLYKNFVDADPGYFNLSEVVMSGSGWFLHSMIDRAWLDFTKGKWQIVAGRQRVNWGINLVWNPNDIFNTFDYFDFDYEERPGSDALKVMYYTGVTSSAEMVLKVDRNNPKDETQSTFAGRYRFSKFKYDFQFIGGWMPKDYVIGGGWMGDIKGGGFRGELSWFIPKNSDSQEALVAAVSGDYTFKNSLYAHAAVLYNSLGVTGNAGGRSFFDLDISAKMLSLGRCNVFGQLSYPFTPLFSGGFAGMLNPFDGSSFMSPSLTYSLGNNLELMLTSQLFLGKEGTEYGELGKALYGRLKWAF
ncbi:hypothetical protein SAMN05444274_102307 [Mariniphaga anaerophila]|uniref:Capsule assembly protein Wzi n=1 Tax=Mariniphaga anaerophila TaxID=1484053 RepID=A0A1M4W3L2_9BACT|nr:hypothetical protein [Mariniphaga anaerophila]SHE75828.1 hypothetical protein SAMN05444274_102307 [Mariniphaga anaerophila]